MYTKLNRQLKHIYFCNRKKKHFFVLLENLNLMEDFEGKCSFAQMITKFTSIYHYRILHSYSCNCANIIGSGSAILC